MDDLSNMESTHNPSDAGVQERIDQYELTRKLGGGRGILWIGLVAAVCAAVAAICLFGGTTNAGAEKTVTLPGGAQMRFRWCPPGSFTMGSPADEEGRSNTERQHRVTLKKGFWLGETEVTQGQWESVTGSNPSGFKGSDRPVENVSRDDCQEFIEKVNARLSGERVRLPTEAEWEYACRAGTTGAYGGTGDIDEMGWFDKNSGEVTHPVGQKKPNAWGLYDMHGNVWEWCNDWFGNYPKGAVTDPQAPASEVSHVLRGGCWYDWASFCRSARRGGSRPASSSRNIGFRLCCSAGPRG